jgi:hypothetical protein
MVEQDPPPAIREVEMTSQRILGTALDDLMPPGKTPDLKWPVRERAPENSVALEELIESAAKSHRTIAKLLRQASGDA